MNILLVYAIARREIKDGLRSAIIADADAGRVVNHTYPFGIGIGMKRRMSAYIKRRKKKGETNESEAS